MAQVVCVNCWQELGLFTGKIRINNGFVCKSCLRAAGINELENPSAFTADGMRSLLSTRIFAMKTFKPTKKIGNFMQVDEINRLFRIERDTYLFYDLLNFELIEDGETITYGGLAQAIAGGLVFGRVGAIVGGLTAGRKTKGICHSMQIKITFRNSQRSMVYISFITEEIKTKSSEYVTARGYAQECLSALQIIADTNKAARPVQPMTPQQQQHQLQPQPQHQYQQPQAVNPADEIMRYKQLLDAGAITEAEFNFKKRQLLGI